MRVSCIHHGPETITWDLKDDAIHVSAPSLKPNGDVYTLVGDGRLERQIDSLVFSPGRGGDEGGKDDGVEELLG